MFVEILSIEIFRLVRITQAHGQFERVGQANAIVRENGPARRVLLIYISRAQAARPCVGRQRAHSALQERVVVGAELVAEDELIA